MEPGPVHCAPAPEAGLRLCAHLGSEAGLRGGRGGPRRGGRECGKCTDSDDRYGHHWSLRSHGCLMRLGQENSWKWPSVGLNTFRGLSPVLDESKYTSWRRLGASRGSPIWSGGAKGSLAS